MTPLYLVLIDLLMMCQIIGFKLRRENTPAKRGAVTFDNICMTFHRRSSGACINCNKNAGLSFLHTRCAGAFIHHLFLRILPDPHRAADAVPRCPRHSRENIVLLPPAQYPDQGHDQCLFKVHQLSVRYYDLYAHRRQGLP